MILVLISDFDTRLKKKVIGLWQIGKRVHKFLATIEKVVKRFIETFSVSGPTRNRLDGIYKVH